MSKIRTIRNIVLRCGTPDEQLRAIQGSYADRRMWLFSCSSELNEHTHESLDDAIAPNDCVACVKQSITRAPRCDFHLLNRIKLDAYEYGANHPVTIGYEQGGCRPPCDIVCGFSTPSYRPEDSVTSRGDFDAWTFEKTHVRPYGPGIVNELGFYLAVHLGVREVVTVGYDAEWIGRFDDRPPVTQELCYILTTQGKWRDWLATKGVAWIRGADVLKQGAAT